METKTVEKRARMTESKITRERAGVTGAVITPVTAAPITRRRYKARARRCKCGCGRMVTPTASAPHQKYFDDACRARGYRQRVAKAKKMTPADPVLGLTTCAWCDGSFFT